MASISAVTIGSKHIVLRADFTAIPYPGPYWTEIRFYQDGTQKIAYSVTSTQTYQQHDFTGLTPGTGYNLKAMIKTATGSLTNVGSQTSTFTTLSAPTVSSISTTSYETSITATATATRASTYVWYLDGVQKATTSTNSYTFTGLTANHLSYSIQCTAKDSEGASGSKTVTASTLPAMPTWDSSLTAITQTSIKVGVTSVSGLQYQFSFNNGSWSTASTTNAVTYGNLPPNGTYDIYVRAYNPSSGFYSTSNSVTKTTNSQQWDGNTVKTTSTITAGVLAITGVSFEWSTNNSTWYTSSPDNRFPWSGLTDCTTYTLYCRGKNTTSGYYGNPISANASTDPLPPTFTLTSPNTTTLTLTFSDGNATAKGWNIQYRESGSSTWLPTTPYSTTSTTYTISSGISAGKTYDVQAQAYQRTNTSNTSTWTQHNISTSLPLPGVPTIGTVTFTTPATGAEATINFSYGTNATRVDLDKEQDGTVNDYNLSQTYFVWSGLPWNTTKYFAIRSVNATGNSAWVNSSFLTPPIPIPADMSSGVALDTDGYPTTARDDNGSSALFHLDWGSADYATSYDIDYSTSSTFASGVSTSNFSNTFGSISGLAYGTKYYFRGKGKNYNNKTSLYQSSVNYCLTTSATTVPKSPTITFSSITQTSFTTTVSVGSGNWTYCNLALYDSTNTNPIKDGSGNAIVKTVTYPTTTATFNTSLSAGTTYYVRAATYIQVGTSPDSSVDLRCVGSYSNSTKTLDSLPGVPGIVTKTGYTEKADKTSCGIDLSWTAPSSGGAYTGYVLAWSTDNVTYTTINVGNVTTYSFTGLPYVTAYWYKVKAINSNNSLESAYTSPQKATTPPKTPSTLSFDNINRDWFRAYISTTGITYSYINFALYDSSNINPIRDASNNPIIKRVDVAGYATVFDTYLSAGTTYTVRVATYYTTVDGDIRCVGTLTGTVTTTSEPDTPTGFMLDSSYANGGRDETGSLSALHLKWNASARATSYTLSYGEDGTGVWTDIANITTTTYLLEDLWPSTRYWFKIKAVNTYGSSDWNSTTGVPASTAPYTPTLYSTTSLTTTSFSVDIGTLLGKQDGFTLGLYDTNGNSLNQWKTINTTSPDIQTVSFTGIATGSYIVRAWSFWNAPEVDGTSTKLNSRYYGEIQVKTTGIRPTYFSWTGGDKVPGSTYSMTAKDWYDFLVNINGVRDYKGLTKYTSYPYGTFSGENGFTIPTVPAPATKENFYYYMFNQAINAISEMNPPTSPPLKKNSGDDVSASDINLIKNSINSVV